MHLMDSPRNMPDQAKKPEPPVALAELPPFPAVAIRALRLTANPDTRLRELHDVICTDQVFAAELLKTANSPIHGIRSTIKSTLQASILLGYERLKKVVLTIAVRGYLAKVMEIPALRACWRHSLACAIVAEELAVASFAAKSETPVQPDKDFAYTAGILHDLGRLVLAVWKPKQYADFLQGTEKQPCNILAQEEKLFGINHCQIGRSLIAAWGLPVEFTEIICDHHDDMHCPHCNVFAGVRFGCRMSDTLGFAVACSTSTPTYEALLSELPEGVRKRFGANRDEQASRITRKINLIELN